MEEEKKLYPLTFCTLEYKYSWGTEQFRLADLGYRDTLVREGWLAGNTIGEVMDTYLDRVVGDNVYEYYGRQFPVCVRNLKVSQGGKTPLTAGPDDETAQQRYDFLGKDKFWYILRAGRDARVALGFKKDSTAGEFFAACKDGNAEALLNITAVHTGQALLIPAGTPHFAAGEVEILEVSESSPLDFCLYRYDETEHAEQFDPSLGLTEALDFLNYNAFKEETPPSSTPKDSSPVGSILAERDSFRIKQINLSIPLKVRSETPEADAFVLYCCVGGAATLEVKLPYSDATANYTIKTGDLVLVPAECGEFNLVPTERESVLLEVTVNRIEHDKYLEPNK